LATDARCAASEVARGGFAVAARGLSTAIATGTRAASMRTLASARQRVARRANHERRVFREAVLCVEEGEMVR
jgi:hypothetical protein